MLGREAFWHHLWQDHAPALFVLYGTSDPVQRLCMGGADLLKLVCPETSSVNFDDASEEPAVRVVITERFGLEALTVPESSKPNLTHVMAR